MTPITFKCFTSVMSRFVLLSCGSLYSVYFGRIQSVSVCACLLEQFVRVVEDDQNNLTVTKHAWLIDRCLILCVCVCCQILLVLKWHCVSCPHAGTPATKQSDLMLVKVGKVNVGVRLAVHHRVHELYIHLQKGAVGREMSTHPQSVGTWHFTFAVDT